MNHNHLVCEIVPVRSCDEQGKTHCLECPHTQSPCSRGKTGVLLPRSTPCDVVGLDDWRDAQSDGGVHNRAHTAVVGGKGEGG